MASLVLVRYGELALKSAPVRREFEHRLRQNILAQFVRAGQPCRLRSDHGHVYVEADDGVTAVRLLRRTFGVTSVSVAVEVPTERSAMLAALFPLAEVALRPDCSFALRARRTGTHPFTSQELGRDLGGEIFEKYKGIGVTVDLDHPDVELFVEVRGPRTYLYDSRATGPGGLPLGVAGRVVALVDGERGALGAYLMMKRGCRCDWVAAGEGVPLVATVLRAFDPHSKDLPKDDGLATDLALQSRLESTRADGVVLPLLVDDYAAARTRWGDVVVFSPTVGLTDEEVATRWRAVAELAV
ncbi:MAG: THUMP domain-containing protein [Thermoplasmata archaeon]|nr:THUMP domain-containing protein [Thermoplasmata archaeon]MCI4362398.1 THUMP domain-containing protein [Thermoplasmata archaeon]